jgi:hypothetical protein
MLCCSLLSISALLNLAAAFVAPANSNLNMRSTIATLKAAVSAPVEPAELRGELY